MATITLGAKLRDVNDKKAKILREEGFIPAILYGKNIPSRSLMVDCKEFEKVYKQAGASTLVELKIESNEPIMVIVQEVAPHYLTLKPIHIDFYQVSMTEKIIAKIPFKFIGESPAVKELSGILLKNMHEVEVECLAKDLVSTIEVDISFIKTFDDSIQIKDIAVPSGITILNKPSENVALVQPPRVEEAAVEKTETEAIESIEKAGEKKEKEEEKEEEEKK